MRIVIEDGDQITIETRRATERATPGATADAIDGGGAPMALIRQHGEGNAIATSEPMPVEQSKAPGGEAPLNPLRAGEQAARGATAESEGTT